MHMIHGLLVQVVHGVLEDVLVNALKNVRHAAMIVNDYCMT